MTYIGKSKRPESRWKNHVDGLSPESLVHRAIAKHGQDSFDFWVVSTFDSEPEAYEAEKFWISELKTKAPGGFNMTDGGDGGTNPTPETRAKMSAAHTPERRARIAATNTATKKGKKASPETREKMSLARKGRKHTPEGLSKRTLSIRIRLRLDQVVSLYLALGSAKAVSSHLGISHSSVLDELHRANVLIRRGPRPAIYDQDSVVPLYRRFRSIEQVAKILGVNAELISKELDRREEPKHPSGPRRGAVRSASHRANLSASKLGSKLSEETKRRISETKRENAADKKAERDAWLQVDEQ